jgi:shikimate dehydrogenase
LRIGAVNCLYRDASGRLMGTNTDGEGALKSLESAFGSISGASVLLIGCGGAGKAVATYLAAAVGSTGQLQISNRNRTAATQFVEALGVEDAAWPVLSAEIEAADIVVNCTSIGAGELRDYTPLAAVDVLSASANQDICRTSLDGARPDCLIFDIIYDPAETKMLQTAKNRGLRCLNGKAMNFEQAVLGFRYATPQAGSLEFVTSVMNAAL